MNVEVSGLQSVFSVLTGGGQLPDNWWQDGVLHDQFVAALNEQIALLQQVPEAARTALKPDAASLLPELAALAGKKLPVAGDPVDIDLEATLQALAEVLKTIETNEAPPMTADLSDDSNVSIEEVSGAVLQMLDTPLAASQGLGQTSVASEQAANLETVVSAALPDKKASMVSSQADNSLVAPSETGEAEVLLEGEEAAGQRQDNLSDGEEKHFGETLGGKKGGIGAVEQGGQRAPVDIAQLNRSVGSLLKPDLAPMDRHFSHPQWNNEFAEKLVWMHKQNIPSAELNLNPRHLGPISIRIDVNQEQASIAFTAHHAVVKDAIEAAIPRLREMLGSQQLNLVNVDVSQQQSEQRQADGFFQMADQRRGNNGGDGFPADVGPDDIVEEIEAGRAIASQGILSLFA